MERICILDPPVECFVSNPHKEAQGKRKGKGTYQISNCELVHGTSLPKFKPLMFRGPMHLLLCYRYNSIGWLETDMNFLSSQVILFSSDSTNYFGIVLACAQLPLRFFCYVKTQTRGWLLH